LGILTGAIFGFKVGLIVFALGMLLAILLVVAAAMRARRNIRELADEGRRIREDQQTSDGASSRLIVDDQSGRYGGPGSYGATGRAPYPGHRAGNTGTTRRFEGGDADGVDN
jgi:hypothetical protein